MRKGERAALALASGASRAAALRAELEHDRNMDLAAAAEAIGDCKDFVKLRGFEYGHSSEVLCEGFWHLGFLRVLDMCSVHFLSVIKKNVFLLFIFIYGV